MFTKCLERDFPCNRIAYVGVWDGYLPTEPGVLDLIESSFGAFEKLACTVERALPDHDPAKIWQAYEKQAHWVDRVVPSGLRDDALPNGIAGTSALGMDQASPPVPS